MTSTTLQIKWSAIFIASLSVLVISFVLVAAAIFAYAFSLGFAARGAPDSAAIQQFANAIGPVWGPRLAIILTALAAIWVGRRATLNNTITRQ